MTRGFVHDLPQGGRQRVALVYETRRLGKCQQWADCKIHPVGPRQVLQGVFAAQIPCSVAVRVTILTNSYVGSDAWTPGMFQQLNYYPSAPAYNTVMACRGLLMQEIVTVFHVFFQKIFLILLHFSICRVAASRMANKSACPGLLGAERVSQMIIDLDK